MARSLNHLLLASIWAMVVLSVSATGWATERSALTPEQADFFEKNVRPVLVENCYKCHSKSGEKIKGGLLLDSREGLLKGGNTGVVVVPGEVEKSLLIKAIRYSDEDLQM